MWDQYDGHVGQVLGPRLRLRVLQGEGSFGEGITSDAAAPADVPDVNELIAALDAFPQLRVAAGEVLYQSIGNRASLEVLRRAALELRGVLVQRLGREPNSVGGRRDEVGYVLPTRPVKLGGQVN
jgi:hypothetical protein